MTTLSNPIDFPNMQDPVLTIDESVEQLAEDNLISFFETGFTTFAQDGVFDFENQAECQQGFRQWQEEVTQNLNIGEKEGLSIFKQVLDKYRAIGWRIIEGECSNPHLAYPRYVAFRSN